ncbi:UNVERIFIED_CONTAM: Retrovirus-related Pol polyprotein from transposon TNT 1-94 [Sesamum radiatum]|uniref:Retrovirus-related Pol polyprotein from transposon TNT 1-94 n=1 Tax=Sesamum radiatum TaxID=300843 RepID=A0AAW2TWF0_SESRA
MSGYNLTPFDGKSDFSIWKQKMKGILIQQRVFKAIDGKYPENISEEKQFENDKFAYSSIILNLSDSVIRKVGNHSSAKELWDKLNELYTESSLPSKLFLLEKFFRYKLDASKTIDDNIDDFTKLIQDIKLTGDKNIDDYSPIVLLNAIPETYGDVKSTIKYGRDSVNLETVINGLKSKEIDLKSSKPVQNQPEVNLVRGRAKNRNHDYKHRKHSNSRSRSRGRSNSKPKYHRDRYEKKDVRCYNCGGRGHFIRDCKKPRKDPPRESANNSDDTVDEVYMLSDVNAVKSVLNKHEWLIDSGCTVHMTPYRDILSNYKSENLGSVSMANEKCCDILGVGDVCMIFENGFKFTLKNVKHVPDLAHNLISCSALEEEGLEGRWGRGIMKIMKGSLCVFKAERKKNLYICSVSYDIIAASVTHMNTSDLWHKRLGHISSKGLELLHKHGVLNDKVNDLSFCDDCILEVFEKFKTWKTFVENQTGKRIKTLRTDNGLEFCNKQFSELCDEFGIKRHNTTPYTPQQNGVAERMNRTLLNKVRCLLISSGLPKTFWGEALLTAAYLINRSPSVPLNGKIPESVWTGKNGYRLWLRSQPGFKVIISRNVTFNETEMPCLSSSLKNQHSSDIDSIFNKVETDQIDNQQGEENEIEGNQHLDNQVENPQAPSLDHNTYQLTRDRERRVPRLPSKFRDYHLALNTDFSEPSSYEEALESKNSEKWKSAMEEEISSLMKNKT